MGKKNEHRLIEVRERKGLTQEDLAKACGTSRGQIANLESGNRRMTIDWLRRLAKALKCSVADLLLPEDVPNQPGTDDAALLASLQHIDADDRHLAARITVELVQLVKRNAARRSAGALAGDEFQIAQLADVWNALDADQRERALKFLAATLHLQSGALRAAA